MVTLDKIYHASYVLKDVIRNTELIKAPKIRTDCDVYLKPENLQVGHVVLAWVNGTHYVVHRIKEIQGTAITLTGDGNFGALEHCQLSDVRALATHVVDAKGQKHDLYNKSKTINLW